MNILQLNNFITQNGGAETVMNTITQILKNNNHFVVNMGYETPELPKIESAVSLGIAHHSLTSFFYNPSLLDFIRKYILSNNIDLIMCHNIYHKYPMAQLFQMFKQMNIPFLLVLHDPKICCPWGGCRSIKGYCHECKNGNYFNAVKNKCRDNSYLKSLLLSFDSYYNVTIQDVYKYPNVIISPSRFLRELAYEMGNKHKIEWIPNPININLGNKRVHVYDNKHIRVLFAGRFTEEKGCFLLKRYAQQNPDICFYWAGAGPMQDQMQMWANDLPNVKYLGFLTKEQLTRQFEEVDYLIIPSIFYENNPMFVLEAMK